MNPASLAAFGQVIAIDLLLAGDNAIVIGTIAAGLAPAHRRRVILIGILAAVIARCAFALGVVWLLSIVGLVFFGGLLLLWVAYKMWRELQPHEAEEDAGSQASAERSFWGAVAAVTIADITMSLDNVLGVAGAAREHPWAMVAGLVISVALMGGAASLIAQVITRYRWLAFVGLGLIVFVAVRMIVDGAQQMGCFQ